jgi:hypothetical protein
MRKPTEIPAPYRTIPHGWAFCPFLAFEVPLTPGGLVIVVGLLRLTIGKR